MNLENNEIKEEKVKLTEKQKINDWINELTKQVFFGDVYLEDMILTIR